MKSISFNEKNGAKVIIAANDVVISNFNEEYIIGAIIKRLVNGHYSYLVAPRRKLAQINILKEGNMDLYVNNRSNTSISNDEKIITEKLLKGWIQKESEKWKVENKGSNTKKANKLVREKNVSSLKNNNNKKTREQHENKKKKSKINKKKEIRDDFDDDDEEIEVESIIEIDNGSLLKKKRENEKGRIKKNMKLENKVADKEYVILFDNYMFLE
jgi:hypothetical protein